MARCYNRYGREVYCNSRWNSWGRWVLFGVIVASFILFFFLFRYVPTTPPPLFPLPAYVLLNPRLAAYQLVVAAREDCDHFMVQDGRA